MEPIKLRLLNKYGASEPLGNPEEIEVHFPYESTDGLVKRMTHGGVRILNDAKGEIAVSVSQFELQGFPVGDGQSFSVKIKIGAHYKEAVFTRCLNVRTMVTDDGQQRKVIVRT